jgi:hypothetical protein
MNNPKVIRQWYEDCDSDNYELEYRLVHTGIKAEVHFRYSNDRYWSIVEDKQRALDVIGNYLGR